MSIQILTADSLRDMQPGEILELMFEADGRGERDTDFLIAARRHLIEEELFTQRDIDEEMERMYNAWDAQSTMEKREAYDEMMAERDCHEARGC